MLWSRNELAPSVLVLRLFDALLDEQPAIVALGEQVVVSAARDANVRRGGRPASAEGLLVMEFELAALFAAPAVRAHEGAVHAVARQHLPPNRMWNVTTGRLGPTLLRRPADASFAAHTEAPLHAVCDQQIERPLHDLCQVPVGQFMTHQVASLLQLVVKLLTRGELQLVSAGPERTERRPGAGRSRGCSSSRGSWARRDARRAWRR